MKCYLFKTLLPTIGSIGKKLEKMSRYMLSSFEAFKTSHKDVDPCLWPLEVEPSFRIGDTAATTMPFQTYYHHVVVVIPPTRVLFIVDNILMRLFLSLHFVINVWIGMLERTLNLGISNLQKLPTLWGSYCWKIFEGEDFYLRGIEQCLEKNTQQTFGKWMETKTCNGIPISWNSQQERNWSTDQECNELQAFIFFEKNKHKHTNEYQSIFSLTQTFLMNYGMLQYPVLWNRGNNLDTQIDVPMHLLFLGRAKTGERMIQAWCSLCGCTTTFTKHASSTLHSLDDIRFSWMVCVPYTGAKLGVWISENYLALARLNCWFYSMLSTVETYYQFIEPQMPQQDWTMK
jgi:hypothetical protein